jgi:PadR family transcriptional regulator, regulatory protein AphA
MSLRHAVLGLLAEFPGSGYDLMKVFNKALSHVWLATQGQVYTELNKLADDGLIAVSEQGPRGRKQYTVTDAGLAELQHWLAETRPVPHRRSEQLLRVYFLSYLPPDKARDYLTWLSETHAAQAEYLREISDELAERTSDLSRYSRLVAEYGIRNAAMTAEWATWAIAQLEEIEQHRENPGP